MFRRLLSAPPPRHPFVCLFCAARPQTRLLSATAARSKKPSKSKEPAASGSPDQDEEHTKNAAGKAKQPRQKKVAKGVKALKTAEAVKAVQEAISEGELEISAIDLLSSLTRRDSAVKDTRQPKSPKAAATTSVPSALLNSKSASKSLRIPMRKRRMLNLQTRQKEGMNRKTWDRFSGHDVDERPDEPKTLQEAMQGRSLEEAAEELAKELAKDDEIWRRNAKDLQTVSAEALDFQPVDVDIPPIPMLAHGLDRVLFNPSVYRLQDPRSRVYNFDPYLEKIMPVTEFDFESLSAYKTSSKDDKLLAITKRLGVKFTGSTSSMSGVLQHFHYLLSNWRKLNHHGLSRQFPDPSGKFTRITTGPQAIFLRWKNGAYAIDADKAFDSPNVMSWLGHSMEKLLTSTPDEFERYRRSNPEQAPSEVESGKSYHYSRLGNFLMRSQLDAHDPRLPGTGVFDLKTRAVLAIRMDHARYEKGAGYQLRYDQGQWESFEREDYDMARATMLKYSMQARMGRMDGIFVAYHNVERIFGFQYFSLSDMDYILHGQRDTCLGDKEFKLSVSLLDEILQRATAKYPETSIRLHFETLAGRHPAMSIYAEPVTEERVEEIQLTNAAAMREFEEKHVRGISEDAAQEIVDENVMDELTGNDKSGEEDVATSDGEAAAGALPKQQDITDATAPDTDPPLMGWTLTCRNRVNGQFVRQVTDLGPSDDYSIEYLVRDIAPDTQRKGYNMLKERRRALFDFHNKVEDVRLKIYRAQINKITRQGREWRDEQDKIDEQMSKLVYRPLGPGSEKVIQEMGPSHAVHW